MEILDSPFQLCIVIVLSVVSFIYSWRGFREKNVPDLCIGIGTSVPTFAMTSTTAWVVGIGLVLFGLYLKRRFEEL